MTDDPQAIPEETGYNRFDPDFFKKIGSKGGKATRARRGPAFYKEIGNLGGVSVKEKYGPEFYRDIGHKGGQAVRSLIAEARRSLAEQAAQSERLLTAAPIDGAKVDDVMAYIED